MEAKSTEYLVSKNSTQLLGDSQKDGELLSEYQMNFFILINQGTLSTIICLFGIVGNSINISVFVKQGLTTSINTSFFAMAVSDLLEVVFQIWHNTCMNPDLIQTDSFIDFVGIKYLTAATPSVLLVRITGWIAVFITAERCLSIAVPLKIKQIVTPKRTTAVLVFIYAMNIAGIVPLYNASYFSWTFYPDRNRTKLGISYSNNVVEMTNWTSSYYSSMTIIAFVLVILFTSILVFSLRQKSKWRRKSTVQCKPTDTITTKEKKTINTVIVVAGVLIVCYTPGIFFNIATSISDEFGLAGIQINVIQAAWSFAFLLHSVNSSITILLYYKTSTKYRKTLQAMFPKCFCGRDLSGTTSNLNTSLNASKDIVSFSYADQKDS